jgi:hypothetical protein
MRRLVSLLLIASTVAFMASTGCTGTTPVGDGDGDGDGDIVGDGDGDGDTFTNLSGSRREMGDGDGDIVTPPIDPVPAPPFKASTRGKLVWKRWATFEADLMGALALGQEELCNELGLFNCARYVHLVALGGNEPFVKALYEPLKSPSVTTSIAVDRVVLSACSRAVERDAAGSAQVFTDLDLGAAAVSAGAEVDATVQTLYRRLHARDPLPEELEALQALLVDDNDAPVSAKDFAKLSCFAIAGTSEMVLY